MPESGIGAAAWIVVGVTIAVLAAAVVAAIVRVRRNVALAMLVAAAFPFVVAIVAGVPEMMGSFQTIETLRAPTPKDLAASVHRGLICTTFGVAGTAACVLAGAVALRRSRAADVPPPIADERPL